MIRYSLTCADNHAFESWFQSAQAYDRLHAAGHVVCAVCGSATVSKSLMAPSVRASRGENLPAAPAPDPRPLSAPPADPAEAALAALRRHVEKNSEYVGMNFAAEARAIHDGSSPERAIYGEARPDTARQLIEDGIPVAPLPFLPTRKAN
jgi:hypothetical protein